MVPFVYSAVIKKVTTRIVDFCILNKPFYMTLERTYEIKDGKQLIISLPDKFRSKKRVRVIIKDVDEDKQSKLEYLKKAANDPLFLSDVQEIQEDFQYTDKESL